MVDTPCPGSMLPRRPLQFCTASGQPRRCGHCWPKSGFQAPAYSVTRAISRSSAPRTQCPGFQTRAMPGGAPQLNVLHGLSLSDRTRLLGSLPDVLGHLQVNTSRTKFSRVQLSYQTFSSAFYGTSGTFLSWFTLMCPPKLLISRGQSTLV